MEKLFLNQNCHSMPKIRFEIKMVIFNQVDIFEPKLSFQNHTRNFQPKLSFSKQKIIVFEQKISLKNNFIFSFFCTEWIVAEANSQVQYFTHEKGAVGSRVKLQMGFSKVNITLKALDEELFPNRYWNERIAINSADDDFQGLMRDGLPVSTLIILRLLKFILRQSFVKSQKFVKIHRVFKFIKNSRILKSLRNC